MGVPEDIDMKSRKVKILGLTAIIIFVGGFILAWLSGNGYLPYGIYIDPTMIIGLSVLVACMLICCTASLLTGSYAAKIPGYGEMEIIFGKGKEHYEAEEYEEALAVFKELMGPQMNHKRALYYAAKCAEALDNHEEVITYLQAYIEMQSKDKEVWLMLANAHKKLFQYEEAHDAEAKAQKL